MVQSITFAIIVPSYNNARWCVKNLTSIAEQQYPHFHLYYINDCSTDETPQLVKNFLNSSSLKERSTFIDNKERKGALANFYDVIHQIDPHTVIVCVDGDDWLAHPHVLQRVAQAYQNPQIWLTYGDFDSDPPGLRGFCDEIPLHISKTLRFRIYPWVSSHLRTFYAKLFQRIRKEDLLHEGAFFFMAADIATMFPMLEMASEGHFQFINEVLYIYNIQNSISDIKVDEAMQKRLSWIIRDKTVYEPVKNLF